MTVPWNKGKTKETDSRVRKISKTFKKKRIDNFYSWRQAKIKQGEIISYYPPFVRSTELATLIGLILGDGNISKFPRCERLIITLGTDKPKLILFAKQLVEQVFSKKPAVAKYALENAIRISLYQKYISKRLGVPSGERKYSKKGLPRWIWKSRKYLLAGLRGLYEAEAYLSIHLPSSTYNFAFVNCNEKLLLDVKTALIKLGYHPEIRSNAIRLRKRDEVKSFEKLISFRQY